MLHTGIDLHKRTCVLATVNGEGEIVAEAELRTSRPAIRYAGATLLPTVYLANL